VKATHLVLALLLLGAAGCSASLRAQPEDGSDYLRYVAFEAPGNEHVLLRWPERKMPLRIYLPQPPDGLFDDPQAIFGAAREGVLAWTDVAGPGLPSFDLVASAGEAEFPIAWAGSQPSWSIAHCFYDIAILQRRFGVAQIVVTGRFRDGTFATAEMIRAVVSHEVGHALGLGGHSPNPEDVMYGFADPLEGEAGDVAAPAEDPPRPRHRTLTARDRETLRLLYARPIGARIHAPRQAY
jgi:hypothetical protein